VTLSAGKISRGFAPIAQSDATTLILGSLPSVRSIQLGEYFAHPRNTFWRIMAEAIQVDPANSYAQRVASLLAARIAVWDVLEHAVRPGSLDASIKAESAMPNDFETFLREHSALRRVCFNGQKAATIFSRRVLAGLGERGRALSLVTLPSTSPAYAAMTFEEKSERWLIGLAIGPRMTNRCSAMSADQAKGNVK